MILNKMSSLKPVTLTCLYCSVCPNAYHDYEFIIGSNESRMSVLDTVNDRKGYTILVTLHEINGI